MRLAKIILSLISLAALTGCTNTTKMTERIKNHPVNETVIVSKLFFKERCVINKTFPSELKLELDAEKTPTTKEFFTTLAAAAIPGLVDQGFKFVEKQIEEMKKDLTATSTAQTHYTLLKDNTKKDNCIGCLIFARGKAGNKIEPDATGNIATGNIWNPTTLQEVGLLAPPLFYMEFWVYFADKQGKHVALTPSFLDYAQTAAKRSGMKKKKDVLITFQFMPAASANKTPSSQPGPPMPPLPAKKLATEAKEVEKPEKPSADDKGLSFVFSFPQLEIGTRLERSALKGLSTLAEPLDIGYKGQFTNIQATVLETEEAGDLLLEASIFVSENKGKLSPVVVDALQKILEVKTDGDKDK